MNSLDALVDIVGEITSKNAKSVVPMEQINAVEEMRLSRRCWKTKKY